MSLQAVSTSTASAAGSPVGIFCMAGDFPFRNWCDCCGNAPCTCFTDLTSVDLTNANSNNYTITMSTWTCSNCGVLVPMGTYHTCNWFPSGTGTAPVMIPSIFGEVPVRECALCDKVLEPEEKKMCKDCRGVFEAWKFLTKRPDPEDGGDEEK